MFIRIVNKFKKIQGGKATFPLKPQLLVGEAKGEKPPRY